MSAGPEGPRTTAGQSRRVGQPPRLARSILRRCLPPGSSAESILGDLEQEFRERSASRRRWWYRTTALRLAASYVGARAAGILQRSGIRRHLAGLRHDLQHAFRGLLRRPAYALVGISTLALGIGVTTAVFSIVNGALLRQLPYDRPEQILRLADRGIESPPESLSSMSALNFRDLRERSRAFVALAAYQHWSYNVSGPAAGGDRAQRVSAVRAEPGFFELLGVAPYLGRWFRAEDGEPGATPVVIIGHDLWRSRFAADREVVGKEVLLDLVPHRIAGVLPPDFAFLRQPEAWTPLSLESSNFGLRRQRQLDGLGRLRPGVDPEEGIAELQQIFAELAREDPEANERWTVTGVPVHEWRVRGGRSRLLLFSGAVLIVLLIACVNVAGLALVRAESRRHELGVRAALGAGRGRLARLGIIESLLVAVSGGAVGAAMSVFLVGYVLATYGSRIPRAEEVQVDLVTMGFALALSTLVGVLVGLAPTLQLRRSPVHTVLKASARGAGSQRLREIFVVVEVALAVVLVAGAGLLLSSTARLARIDLGVDSNRALTFAIGVPDARYDSSEEVLQFWSRLEAEIGSIPGVEAVGLASLTPLRGGTNGPVLIGDGDDAPGPMTELRAIRGDYFGALGMRVIAGRGPEPEDREQDPLPVLVNQALARTAPDGTSLLGASLRPSWSSQRFVVVGVVNDVRDFGAESDPRPTIYSPVGAAPFGLSRYLNAIVRTRPDPRTMLAAVRERVRGLDSDVPLSDVGTLGDLALRSQGTDRRWALSLFTAFAGFALVLGAVGIYAIMSFAVAQRTREIGVRVALGATPGALQRLVIGRGLAITTIGLAIGICLTVLAGGLLQSLLYEVAPTDPMNLVAVGTVLLATAALACFVPARRAVRVEVVEALASE